MEETIKFIDNETGDCIEAKIVLKTICLFKGIRDDFINFCYYLHINLFNFLCFYQHAHYVQNASRVVRLLLEHRANSSLICNGFSALALAIASGNDLVSCLQYSDYFKMNFTILFFILFYYGIFLF